MIEIDEHEHIIRVVYDHWFVLLGRIILLFLAVSMPVIGFGILRTLPFPSIITIDGNINSALFFFLAIWLMFVWMIGWNIWTNYFLNVLVITDIRIFDIVQKGYFSRKSSSFRIDHIQNITVTQKGLIQTLFDFGTLHFETAGENINFTASYIARPYEVKKMIDEMQDSELSSSQEVHLHPASLERIAPREGDASKGAPVGTFVDNGM
jgi:uncharacterized membrane protein YdbT with pleckstrin-like domain